MKSQSGVEIISALLIFLFIYAGANKLLDHDVFDESLAAFPLLKFGAPVISWLLPMMEIGTAIMLVIPACRLNGLVISPHIAFVVYNLFSHNGFIWCSLTLFLRRCH